MIVLHVQVYLLLHEHIPVHLLLGDEGLHDVDHVYLELVDLVSDRAALVVGGPAAVEVERRDRSEEIGCRRTGGRIAKRCGPLWRAVKQCDDRGALMWCQVRFGTPIGEGGGLQIEFARIAGAGNLMDAALEESILGVHGA